MIWRITLCSPEQFEKVCLHWDPNTSIRSKKNKLKINWYVVLMSKLNLYICLRLTKRTASGSSVTQTNIITFRNTAVNGYKRKLEKRKLGVQHENDLQVLLRENMTKLLAYSWNVCNFVFPLYQQHCMGMLMDRIARVNHVFYSLRAPLIQWYIAYF